MADTWIDQAVGWSAVPTSWLPASGVMVAVGGCALETAVCPVEAAASVARMVVCPAMAVDTVGVEAGAAVLASTGEAGQAVAVVAATAVGTTTAAAAPAGEAMGVLGALGMVGVLATPVQAAALAAALPVSAGIVRSASAVVAPGSVALAAGAAWPSAVASGEADCVVVSAAARAAQALLGTVRQAPVAAAGLELATGAVAVCADSLVSAVCLSLGAVACGKAAAVAAGAGGCRGLPLSCGPVAVMAALPAVVGDVLVRVLPGALRRDDAAHEVVRLRSPVAPRLCLASFLDIETV